MRRPSGLSYKHNRRDLKDVRRTLRSNMTSAEAMLWKLLRRRQLRGRKFRRQHSIGPFVVDFYCPAERLAVELDGEPHNDPSRSTYDEQRAEFLVGEGIRIVRFENRQVFENPEGLLLVIAEHFEASEG